MRNPPHVIKSANGRAKEIQKLEEEHSIEGNAPYLNQLLKDLDFTRNQVKSLKLLNIEKLIHFKKFKAQELHETSGMPDKASLIAIIEKARENGAWFFDDYPRPSFIHGQISKYTTAFSLKAGAGQAELVRAQDAPTTIQEQRLIIQLTDASCREGSTIALQKEIITNNVPVDVSQVITLSPILETPAQKTKKTDKRTIPINTLCVAKTDTNNGVIRTMEEELDYQDSLLGIADDLPAYLIADLSSAYHSHFKGITAGMQKALEEAGIRNMNDLRLHTVKSLRKIKGLGDIKLRLLLDVLKPNGLILFDEMQNHDLVIAQVKKGLKWHRAIQENHEIRTVDNATADNAAISMSPISYSTNDEEQELRILQKVGEMLGNKKDIFLTPVSIYAQQIKNKNSLIRFANYTHILLGDIAMMSKNDLIDLNVSKGSIKEIDTELRELGLRLGLREEAEEVLRQEEDHCQKINARQAYYIKGFEL